MKMLKIGLLILLTLWGISSHAAESEHLSSTREIEGRGHFVAQKGDGLGLIKKQLKYSAFRDVLSKEMIRLGQEPQMFWRKYEEQFQLYFAPIKEQLRTQMFGTETITPEKREKFNKALRKKYLYARVRFGRLDRMIQSYVEKEYGRTKSNPQIHHLKIIASVNRRPLGRWYLKMAQNEQKEMYSRIFLSTHFKLLGGNWNDLGVAEEEDFTEVVREYWKKWLDEHLKESPEETVLMSPNMLEQLQKYLWIPHLEEKPGNYEVSNEPPKKHFINGLWIHLHLSIHKMNEDIDAEKKTFRMAGHFTLMDINNRTFIDQGMLLLPDKTYRSSDPQQLSSTLAQQTWELPLFRFQELKHRFNQRPRHNVQRLGLLFEGLENIRILHQIQEFLENQGIHLGLSSKITFYDGSKGIIEITYRGNKEKLSGFLEGLHGKNVGPHILLKSASHIFSLQKMQGDF